MEKIMIKRHREQRSVTRDRESKKSIHKMENVNVDDKNNVGKNEHSAQGHGIKRSVSHSWEGESHKVSKHKHQTGRLNNNINNEQTNHMRPKLFPNQQMATNNESSNENTYQQGVSSNK